MSLEAAGLEKFRERELREAGVGIVGNTLQPRHRSVPSAAADPTEVETRRNVVSERRALQNSAVGVERFEHRWTIAGKHQVSKRIAFDNRDAGCSGKLDEACLGFFRHAV